VLFVSVLLGRLGLWLPVAMLSPLGLGVQEGTRKQRLVNVALVAACMRLYERVLGGGREYS
jgi:hypothetical protein